MGRKALCITCGTLVAIATNALAQDADTARAVRTQLVVEAEAARRAGDHQRALEQARRAGEIEMSPSLRLFLAAEHAALGAWLEAYNNTVACSREATTATQLADREVVIAQCDRRSAEARAHLGHVVVRVPSDVGEAELRVADRAVPRSLWGLPIPLTPGPVTVSLITRDGRSIRVEMTLAAGESRDVDATPERSEFAPELTTPAAGPTALVLDPTARASLPAGEPQGPCELRAWLDLTPSGWDMRPARTPVAQPGAPPEYVRTPTAWNVVRRHDRGRLDTDEALELMGDQELTERHMAPIRGTRIRTRIGGAMGVVGLAGILGGSIPLFVQATSSDPRDQTVTVASVVTVLAGFALALPGLLAVFPRGEAASSYSLRIRSFVDGEDDIDAVRLGVNRANLRTRTRCEATAR